MASTSSSERNASYRESKSVPYTRFDNARRSRDYWREQALAERAFIDYLMNKAVIGFDPARSS